MMYSKNEKKLTSLLGIQYPVLQGPFGGGLSSARLTAAISNAGALGGYGAYQLQPAEVENVVSEIKQLTNKPFNINLWVNDVDAVTDTSDEEYEKVCAVFRPYFNELNIALPPKPVAAVSKFEKQAEVLLRNNVPVFSFVFGIPDAAILNECGKKKIITIGAATTLDEAIALEEARVDAVVASGFEAGGHRPSFLKPAEDSLTGVFVLTQQLVTKLSTPVIAAGGIIDSKGMKAILSMGAAGVQIGTAFLACEESGASEEYRKVIFSHRAKYTTLTKSFTGRLGRGTMGTISEKTKLKPTLPFPLQTFFMSAIRKAAVEQGKSALLTYWMGQNASLVKHKTVNDFLNSLLNHE